jgi:nucleoside-diphosphate-sugar epimerase
VDFCGLRFGTVCGVSVRQRDELLLNSMVRSAVENGMVNVSNPQAGRSVLALNDLVVTVNRMLDVVPPRGFYNLASYSMSIGAYGAAVARRLGAEIVETPGSGTYTFSVDSGRICRALGRSLGTSMPELVDELAGYYRMRARGVPATEAALLTQLSSDLERPWNRNPYRNPRTTASPAVLAISQS